MTYSDGDDFPRAKIPDALREAFRVGFEMERDGSTAECPFPSELVLGNGHRLRNPERDAWFTGRLWAQTVKHWRQEHEAIVRWGVVGEMY